MKAGQKILPMESAKTYLILLFFIIPGMTGLIAQTTNDQGHLIGAYKSPDYSFFQKLFYNIFQRTSFAVGTTLELRQDSGFYKKTCGNIITGDWKVKADTLLLFYNTNRWRNDSLHQYGYNGEWPQIPSKPEKYIIEGEMLRQRYPIEYNGRKERAVLDLEKVINEKR